MVLGVETPQLPHPHGRLDGAGEEGTMALSTRKESDTHTHRNPAPQPQQLAFLSVN